MYFIYFQKHYQTESERFFLLPPGISPSRKYQNSPAGAREKICKELDIPISSFLLLQIGSDFSRKGVDRSIEALASLPEGRRQKTHLIIIGQDNPNKFIKLANQLKIDKNVHFLLGRDDVPHFIAGSDILLHPARSENTGTVILEAMAGGLPEIVSEECGYSFHVTAAKSGLVLKTPFTQAEFNKALDKCIEEAKSMGADGIIGVRVFTTSKTKNKTSAKVMSSLFYEKLAFIIHQNISID